MRWLRLTLLPIIALAIMESVTAAQAEDLDRLWNTLKQNSCRDRQDAITSLGHIDNSINDMWRFQAALKDNPAASKLLPDLEEAIAELEALRQKVLDHEERMQKYCVTIDRPQGLPYEAEVDAYNAQLTAYENTVRQFLGYADEYKSISARYAKLVEAYQQLAP